MQDEKLAKAAARSVLVTHRMGPLARRRADIGPGACPPWLVVVGEVQLGRQTFATGGPMSRLGFQNNRSPPTKQFQQAQPRRRPRAPHGHATKCRFLVAANRCIATCTSAHHDV